jgi:hypothetical protein
MHSSSASWPAAERRVAQVVRQGHGLHQILVQAQAARDGAPQLGHFQGVRQTGAEQVPLVVEEDLRLVDQPPEGAAVDDAVAVALELAAGGRGGSATRRPRERAGSLA